MRLTLLCLFLIQIGCVSLSGTAAGISSTIAERKPLRKSNVVISSPATYVRRKGPAGEYDPRPRVVTKDAKTGKYEFRWIGNDGKEKVIDYQRPDALDAVVEANVIADPNGGFQYKYLVKNLPASPTHLSGFVVQTLAADVQDKPLPIKDDVFTGHMGSYIPEFEEGVWRRFAPLGETRPKVGPGMQIQFELASTGLPGVVACRATGGDLNLKGVGEHMPSELENQIPGYNSWASGYTIGPITRLAELSQEGRANYVIEQLPIFEEAGWMSSDVISKYRAILKAGDLIAASNRAKDDLKTGKITSEVLHILSGLSIPYAK